MEEALTSVLGNLRRGESVKGASGTAAMGRYLPPGC